MRTSAAAAARFVALPLVVTLAAVFATACSSSSAACAPEGTVTVTVTNQVDSDTNFVCSATVTIAPTTGGATQTLTPQGLDGSNVSCIYVINVAPGTYTVAAAADGYEMATQTLAVQQVACVTASPMTSIALIPTNAGGDDAGDAGGD
jgi:hypothetical protein